MLIVSFWCFSPPNPRRVHMPEQTQTPASRNTGSRTTAAASNVQQAYVPQIQKTVSREQLLGNMDDHGMIFISVTNSIINNKVTFFILAFDFCQFCEVIRFFHTRHNGQWPPTPKDGGRNDLGHCFNFVAFNFTWTISTDCWLLI